MVTKVNHHTTKGCELFQEIFTSLRPEQPRAGPRYLERRDERKLDLGLSSGVVAMEEAGLCPGSTSTRLPDSSMMANCVWRTNMPWFSRHCQFRNTLNIYFSTQLTKVK